MADLTNYAVGPANTSMTIEAEDCAWCNIGSGTYPLYSSSQVQFQGSTDTIVYKGPLDLTVTLSGDGQDCTVLWNGSYYDSTYYTNDDNGDNGQIVISWTTNSGKPEQLSIYQWDSGTRIDWKHNLWIGQDDSSLRHLRGE